MAEFKKFLKCDSCGNFIGMIDEGKGEIICCGAPMKKLEANTSDGAKEKHVPSVSRDAGKISVVIGDTVHPMTEEHYIKWIGLLQGNKMQRTELSPSDEPRAEFNICDDGTPVTVYEYCNLHGLWKLDVK